MSNEVAQKPAKDMQWYVDNQVLDEEELEIQRDMAAGKYIRTRDIEIVRQEFAEAAKHYRRKKPVTVRFEENDITRLKLLAGEKGIPYQTLVSSVIHRYVTGQLKGDA